MFRYYSVARPVMPGSYPKPEKNEILCIQNFDNRTYVEEISRPAWGYIDYKKPLGHFDMTDYELVAVKTKTLHLQYLGRTAGDGMYTKTNTENFGNRQTAVRQERCANASIHYTPQPAISMRANQIAIWQHILT